jgi:two-component system alkaline phosphatase synthesis response regulator PhoP
MKKKEIKILLVDDEPDIIEIIRFNLEQEGYQISSASDGLEAIKVAEKELPHLIIMDVMMPNLDGIYLLASKPDKVFKREKIMEKVWGGDVVVGDRTIDVHIRKLREKIGDHYFKTVKGIGYKFIKPEK